MKRRALLGHAAALSWLAGCSTVLQQPDDIVEAASGRRVSRLELLEVLRGSTYTLLGEQHDNPHHHRLRGELLTALGTRSCVVAEHLQRGVRVSFGAGLLQSLEAAGFDAKGWRWPLHEPLFAAVARLKLALEGGNASREQVRRVAREGETAQPEELRAALSPLSDAGRKALDADLVGGHCGQLPGTRLDGMRAAQRTRDASMWLALQQLRQREGAPLAVLLAGNGHVRRDYGVAQLIAAAEPAARVVVVGFGEPGAEAAPYHFLWTTPAAERADPCAGFSLPKP